MPELAESAHGLFPSYSWRASLPFAAPLGGAGGLWGLTRSLRSGCGPQFEFVSVSIDP
jgi:hypothetical protein